MTRLVDDRYELGDFLASGGMADVYVARDRTLDRRVAIKRLKAHLDDADARARFEREARALAGFSHPNAVAVYDAGNDADGPYIVMELVEGPSLHQYLRDHGRLSFAEAGGIADQVLAALGAAHARGIVHRDVKPANVLFASDGSVKLADFGIAKVMADATSDLTVAGRLIGTPKYVAPEQAVGNPATPRSDLYAVGVLCFEMVTGAAPFVGDTPSATLAAHQHAPVPDLRGVRPDAPDTFVAVVERALAKDPAERFPDAHAMRAALRGERSAVGSATPTVPMAGTVSTDRTVPMAGTVAVSQTRAMAAPPATPGRRRGLWVAAVALGVAVLVAAIVALTRSDGEPDAGSPVAPTAAATLPPSTLPASTLPASTLPASTLPASTLPPTTGRVAVTVPTTPQTLGQLAALVAAGRGTYGTRSDDLLDALTPFIADPTGQSAKDASNLTKEIDRWVRDGELDATIGATATRLLDAYAAALPPPGKAKDDSQDG